MVTQTEVVTLNAHAQPASVCWCGNDGGAAEQSMSAHTLVLCSDYQHVEVHATHYFFSACAKMKCYQHLSFLCCEHDYYF